MLYTSQLFINLLCLILFSRFFLSSLPCRALGQSVPSMSAFAKARVAAAKIFRIIDHKPGIDRNSESGVELDTVTGQVELKNVDFSYPSRPDVRILNNFSLTVPAGKTIALVGSSGSGKSTVVSLIERFYDPSSGIKVTQRSNLDYSNYNMK